ncbi:MAG: hypothetical protein QOI48_1612 [Solirubrobacteraceae bacterium]|nr:hypothetical protein [Solirubrobacteraceae bacterium]
MKQCMYCAEEIHDQAVLCRYCGQDLEPSGPDSTGTALGHEAAPQRSRWGLIWASLLLAAAIPAVWNLSQLEGVQRSTFLSVYFLLNLLPFGFGLWAGALYRGPHPIVGVLLGTAAGVGQALIEGALLTRVEVNGHLLMLGPEDLLAWAATTVLFVAGTFIGSRQTGRRQAAMLAGRQVMGVAKAVRRTVAVVGFLMNAVGFIVLFIQSTPS